MRNRESRNGESDWHQRRARKPAQSANNKAAAITPKNRPKLTQPWPIIPVEILAKTPAPPRLPPNPRAIA